MILSIGVTVALLLLLILLSLLLNGYMDIYQGSGFDGETSVYIALNVFYTVVIGIGGITVAWGGWRMAAYAVVISLAAFAASGIPLMVGDANRQKRRRMRRRK